MQVLHSSKLRGVAPEELADKTKRKMASQDKVTTQLYVRLPVDATFAYQCPESLMVRFWVRKSTYVRPKRWA